MGYGRYIVFCFKQIMFGGTRGGLGNARFFFLSATPSYLWLGLSLSCGAHMLLPILDIVFVYSLCIHQKIIRKPPKYLP